MAEPAGHEHRTRRGPAAVVRRYPLTAYSVLLVALSWPAQLVLPLAVALVGPSVCAFVVVAVAGGRAGVRELWGRVLRWRVPGRYYAFAVAGLGAYLLGTVCAFTALLFPQQLVPRPVTELVLTALLNLPVLFVLVGLGEEFGWRGFVQDRLQHRHGPLAAAVLTGLMWAVWHVPLRIAENGWSAANLGWTVAGITSAAVVYAWLFNRTGGSVLLVALLHAGENTWMGSPFALLFDPGSPDFLFFVHTWNAFYVVLALLVVVLTRGRLGLPSGAIGER
ncbi:CPBP family intramembrane glutamic endopeptidase [Pseudonocardia sp. HH130630-07]|uniref:CPBP family intramembrane glutamic endopeptidase n=1 Tax=Pseudonocardia sp. HH130630-07 TaxID=1690815 RepID=UPI0008150AFE|nr:type II CAAX endopeptidase family protein [Pseudonocardia sp. HH130630-07]ANY08854.1 hypothetical protein AFB00_24255 [Pseudonocardia sp. HH130630-07]